MSTELPPGGVPPTGWVPPPPATGPVDAGKFSAKNTSLGKFSHGNFDVEYDPASATLQVTLRVKFEFADGISADKQRQFKDLFQQAVGRWDQSGVYLKTDQPQALNQTIKIRFKAVESAVYHKRVIVDRDDDGEYRARVLWYIGLSQFDAVRTITHELGHVFGNYDEYAGEGVQSWFERRLWWHDNAYMKQTCTVMNEGTEFPVRYFDHFANFVNENFARTGIGYRAVRDTKVSCE